MSPRLDAIESRLDDLQDKLPPIPAAALRLQRRIGERVFCAATGAANAWRQSVANAAKASTSAARTVTGTAKWAGNKTVQTAATAARTVTGQAAAQSRIAGRAVADEAAELADSARDAAHELRANTVDAMDAVEQVLDDEVTPTAETYDDLTKDELYRRAKALDIEGRSQMSKDELIDAIRKAA